MKITICFTKSSQPLQLTICVLYFMNVITIVSFIQPSRIHHDILTEAIQAKIFQNVLKKLLTLEEKFLQICKV